MFQASGDLGLEDEACTADRVVGVPVDDLLERDLAIQLGIEGQEHGTQASRAVGTKDAEPQTARRRVAHRTCYTRAGFAGVRPGLGEHHVNRKLLSDRVAQLGEPADKFVRIGLVAASFPQENFVVDQVEETLGMVPELGFTRHEGLDEDPIALLPGGTLLVPEALAAIRPFAQCRARVRVGPVA